MIAYVRGRLDAVTGAGEVRIDTDRGPIVARTYAPAAGLAKGDEVIAASATIAVGIEDHDLTALLGPWAQGRPDPAGALGLALTPVVLLSAATTVDVALAGAVRAGRAPGIGRLEGATPALGLALLAATAAGAEVIVITEAEGRHIDLVRTLGGRAVVALPSCNARTVAAWVDGAELGADIPIPTTDRDAATQIASLGLEASHLLVQVDPTPALGAAGAGPSDDFAVLTAAAAGLLAGRIAAGNRRWRADTAP